MTRMARQRDVARFLMCRNPSGLYAEVENSTMFFENTRHVDLPQLISRRGQLENDALAFAECDFDRLALTFMCGDKVRITNVGGCFVECKDLAFACVQPAQSEVTALVGLDLLVNIMTLPTGGIGDADHLQVGNGFTVLINRSTFDGRSFGACEHIEEWRSAPDCEAGIRGVPAINIHFAHDVVAEGSRGRGDHDMVSAWLNIFDGEGTIRLDSRD